MSLITQSARTICANIDETEACEEPCTSCLRQARAVTALCAAEQADDRALVRYMEQLWPERVAEARKAVFWEDGE